MALRLQSVMALLRVAEPYSLYILLILMIVYLLNQLDRFVLGIAGSSLARDLQFGSRSCFLNTSSVDTTAACATMCNNYHSELECIQEGSCLWDYSATGIQYEVLAGPAFTLVFTLAALPLGLLAGAPRVNRRLAIAACLALWSAMTLSASFTSRYWQLLLTRIGLGIFEAICTPFASSIISDLFNNEYRATALGFYNWGIYIGYSMAFAFNFILEAIGWRWTFRVAALPGFLMALVMVVTVKEPRRAVLSRQPHHTVTSGNSFWREVLKALLSPSMLLLSVAGGVRQGAGLVWSYNVKAFFHRYYCSFVNIGAYLSWVPLIGGTMGAVLGGLISDRLVRRRGQAARFWVLIASQLLAAPFLVGTVFLPPNPWAFLCLLPAYIVGEVWIGVCLAIVIEMVPRRVVAVAVAFFLFVINNIGGLFPLLIPALDNKLELRYVILLLFPGAYVVAAILFAVTLAVKVCSSHCGPCRLAQQELPEEQLLIQQSTAVDEELVEDDFVFCRQELLESQDTVVTLPKSRNKIKLLAEAK